MLLEKLCRPQFCMKQLGIRGVEQLNKVNKLGLSTISSSYHRNNILLTQHSNRSKFLKDTLSSWRFLSVQAAEVTSKVHQDIPSNVTFEDETVIQPEAVERDVVVDQQWYAERMPEGPATLPVFSFFNPDLDPAENIDLNEKVWKSDVRIDIIHRVVRWQRAKQRQGTAKQKTISERSGTGRKPFPQKGGGRARQGTLRAPHMRGGGRVHGKVPQDHSFNLPKKVRRYGLRSTLTAKYIEGNVAIVDTLVPSTEKIVAAAKNNTVPIKTRDVLKFLKKLNWQDDSVCFIDSEKNEYLTIASRNLKREVRVVEQVGANVYDLLKISKVVLSESALRTLEGRLLSETGKYICRREGKFQQEVTEEQIIKWEENARKLREKARAKKELEQEQE